MSFLVTHWLLSSYLCRLLTVPVSATAKDPAGSADSLDPALGFFPFPQMCFCFPILHMAMCPCYLVSELAHTRSLLSGNPVHRDANTETPIVKEFACGWYVYERASLFVIPTNFCRPLQHSSNALPFAAVSLSRKGVGCAGEESLWVET